MATWASKDTESVITMLTMKEKPGRLERMTRTVSRQMPASSRARRAASSRSRSMNRLLLRKSEELSKGEKQ
uniref:Uncharacterized protein n=1 Tax=Triticum urartu TaxID=4572 RepID=A0A8R7PXH3_TRIUA